MHGYSLQWDSNAQEGFDAQSLKGHAFRRIVGIAKAMP
jgi:hypothetical protein